MVVKDWHRVSYGSQVVVAPASNSLDSDSIPSCRRFYNRVFNNFTCGDMNYF